MSSSSRRQITRIGLVSCLAMVGAVAVTSINASGQEPPPYTDPPTVRYGTLTIDLTDRSGTVTFDPAQTGMSTLIQAIGVSTPCSTLVLGAIKDDTGTTVSVGKQLLALAATGGDSPNVQLPNSGIGVTDGANCGEPAGLIGPGETLKLSLGDFFATGDSGPKVNTATLNIGKMRAPDGSLRLAFDGGAPGDSIGINNSGQMVNVGGSTVPDFRSVQLQSTASQSSRGLSLKTSTVFNLVVPFGFDAAVDCGDFYPESGLGRNVLFDRLLNGDKFETEEVPAPACEDVGVTIKFGTRTVTWDNGTLGVETGSPQDVRGFVTLNWEGLDLDQLDRLTTYINYQGNDAGPFFPVVWCQSWNGKTTVATGGTAERPAAPVPLRFKDGVSTADKIDANGVVTPAALAVPANFVFGPVPWCMVSNNEVLRSAQVFQTQIFYGAGDPTKFR